MVGKIFVDLFDFRRHAARFNDGQLERHLHPPPPPQLPFMIKIGQSLCAYPSLKIIYTYAYDRYL